MISRRAALGLVATSVPALLLSPGALSAYSPTRPARFLLGSSPGGATAIIALLIRPRLSEKISAQFVVDN